MNSTFTQEDESRLKSLFVIMCFAGQFLSWSIQQLLSPFEVVFNLSTKQLEELYTYLDNIIAKSEKKTWRRTQENKRITDLSMWKELVTLTLLYRDYKVEIAEKEQAIAEQQRKVEKAENAALTPQQILEREQAKLAELLK